MAVELIQSKRPAALALSLLLVALAALISACAPTRVPFLTIVPQSSGPANGTIVLTAACPSGTTRLGGGYFVAPDGRNTGLVVRGSYPSDPNSWTLEVENTSPVPSDNSNFLVVAYCAQRADLTLTATTQITGSAAQFGTSLGPLPKVMIDAPCAAPAALTGGGFYLDGRLTSGDAPYNGGIVESAPDGSVWHVEFGEAAHPASTRLVRAYAVCTTGLQPGSMVEVSKIPAPPPPPEVNPITVTEAICGPSSYTTAGGFRLNGNAHRDSDGTSTLYIERAFQSVATNDFERWNIQTLTLIPSIGGLAPVTAVALCAPIP